MNARTQSVLLIQYRLLMSIVIVGLLPRERSIVLEVQAVGGRCLSVLSTWVEHVSRPLHMNLGLVTLELVAVAKCRGR
jgi:hypothetical protein